MIRTSDGPVNFAGVRLHRATYESPVEVAAGFEQVSCGRGRHTRSWHDIPESGACQGICYDRVESIQVHITRNDNQLSRIVNAGILQNFTLPTPSLRQFLG
jgi:hypothetical protein